jgi:hypothetical protein
MRFVVLLVFCSLLVSSCKLRHHSNQAGLVSMDAVRLGADRSAFQESDNIFCQLHYEAGMLRQYDVFAKKNPSLKYLVQFNGDKCDNIAATFEKGTSRETALQTLQTLLSTSNSKQIGHDEDDLIKKDVNQACEHFTFSPGAAADLYYAPGSADRVDRVEVASVADVANPNP